MPTVTWDAAFLIAPADTDEYKYGANKIRQLKVAVQERLELEHDFANTGKHLPGKVSCLFSGNTAEVAALANMNEGAIAKDTTTSLLKRYNGAAWEDVIPLANETLIGIVTLANSNEATTGTEANKVITPATLANVVNYVMPKRAILQNRQTANTGGGNTTSGSWLIVPINTVYEDINSIVSNANLTANTYSFGLLVGTYVLDGYVMISTGAQYAQLRLFNITANDVQQNINGLDIYSDSGDFLSTTPGTRFKIMGTFILTANSEMRIEYKVQASITNGFGFPSKYGPEIYAQLPITKI